jgi:hypothetical protein
MILHVFRKLSKTGILYTLSRVNGIFKLKTVYYTFVNVFCHWICDAVGFKIRNHWQIFILQRLFLRTVDSLTSYRYILIEWSWPRRCGTVYLIFLRT